MATLPRGHVGYMVILPEPLRRAMRIAAAEKGLKIRLWAEAAIRAAVEAQGVRIPEAAPVDGAGRRRRRPRGRARVRG